MIRLFPVNRDRDSASKSEVENCNAALNHLPDLEISSDAQTLRNRDRDSPDSTRPLHLLRCRSASIHVIFCFCPFSRFR